MGTSMASESERQTVQGGHAKSFAEEALRLSGKSEEESRRTGAVDKADEQVESMFAAQYQTTKSPVHRAACDASMSQCLEIVRRHRLANDLLDEKGKLSNKLLDELAAAGYWGMLIEERYGGQGAPFARFSRFLTQVATYDPMTAGLSSVHGCIGAVDPVRTFGNPEQKSRFLPRLAGGQALSAFALTEPCAGSDLTALRTTAVAVDDHFEVSGEKLLITNAIPGR